MANGKSNKTLEVSEVTEQQAVLQIIQRAATDPQCDVDKMERLLLMQERIHAKQAEAAFAAAMADAQAGMGRVSADANNPQTHSRYATYAALDKALRPIYSEKGFALSFTTDAAAEGDNVLVRCLVSHVGGHTRTYEILMPADGKGAKGGAVMTRTHAAGSAISYGMRYLLRMIFNVAIGNDDDGNAAGETKPKPRKAAGKKQAGITEGQMKKIHATAKEMGHDHAWLKRFCKALGVDSMKDLSKAQGETIIDTLDKVREDRFGEVHEKLQDAFDLACNPPERPENGDE